MTTHAHTHEPDRMSSCDACYQLAAQPGTCLGCGRPWSVPSEPWCSRCVADGGQAVQDRNEHAERLILAAVDTELWRGYELVSSERASFARFPDYDMTRTRHARNATDPSPAWSAWTLTHRVEPGWTHSVGTYGAYETLTDAVVAIERHELRDCRTDRPGLVDELAARAEANPEAEA